MTSGVTGLGPGEVRFTAGENTSSAQRTATLTIAGVAFRVTQAGAVTSPACTYSLSSTTRVRGALAGGGNGTHHGHRADRLQLDGDELGLVADRDLRRERKRKRDGRVLRRRSHGNIAPERLADHRHRDGDREPGGAASPPCTFSVSPTSVDAPAGGVSGDITVTASASTCDWTASASPSWITLTGSTGGTGNGTVAFSIAENTSTSSRTGTITIEGEDIDVSQAAAAPGPATVSGVISSLQGQCPTLTFVVDTRTVRTTSSTDFRAGSCNTIDDGDDVTVEGIVETDNSITATWVRKN